MSVPGDTICAIASPPGGGTRGVVRVSGPRSAEFVRETWVEGEELELDGGRGAFRGRFQDGAGEQPLLLLWMPGPRSFTREDVAELHLPGSPPLLARALSRLVELGARIAEPGEFTRRAFENGRIDLSRAEGVLSLVEARSEAARRSAVALLLGGLDERVGTLRDGIEDLRALCESSLDFESEDTIDVPADEIARRLAEVEVMLEEAREWEVARGLEAGVPRVVLVGAPNAGKSTLFNALGSGAQEAIVSEYPGTTRDRLVRSWRPGVVAVELTDVAGVEEGTSGSDAAAQVVGESARSTADHLMWVVDARRSDAVEMERERMALPEGVERTLVWAQGDREDALMAPPERLAEETWVRVSAARGEGLELLAETVGGVMERALPGGSGRELSVRHSKALEEAAERVCEGRKAWEEGLPLDLLAEQLRGATDQIDRIAGRTTAEDLLDRIFSRFCLGK